MTLQRARYTQRPVYIMFIDLAKAYGMVDRGLLWRCLLEELAIPRDLVGAL